MDRADKTDRKTPQFSPRTASSKPVKVERVSVYVCQVCGKAFVEEGHARLCQGSHIDPKKMVIKQAVLLENGKAYAEGDRFPAAIEIWAEESQNNVIYKKVIAGVSTNRPKRISLLK